MCSCQRTGPGLSCLGMQPQAIESGKFVYASGLGFSDAALLRQKRCGGHFFLTGREKMVGVNGVEPLTPRLSSACSNQLSYTPNGSSERASIEASERGDFHAFTLYAWTLPRSLVELR